jgi:hypothetical protein
MFLEADGSHVAINGAGAVNLYAIAITMADKATLRPYFFSFISSRDLTRCSM